MSELNPFFPTMDYRAASVQLDRFASELSSKAFKVARVMFNKTFGFDKKADVICMDQLMKESGLSKNTVLTALTEVYEKGIFHARQLGKNKQERLVVTGLLESIDLLERYNAREIDQYELLFLSRIRNTAGQNLNSSEQILIPESKNSTAVNENCSAETEKSSAGQNLNPHHDHEKNDLNHDHDLDKVLNDHDGVPDMDNVTVTFSGKPQQLSFLANIFSGFSQVVNIHDRLKIKTPPSSAAPPQSEPSSIADFSRLPVESESEQQAPAADVTPPPTQPPSTVRQLDDSTEYPPIPPDWSSLKPPPGWPKGEAATKAWLEHYNRKKYGITPTETKPPEPKRHTPEPKPPSKKQLEAQANRDKAIADLMSIPIRDQVWNLYEEYLANEPRHDRDKAKDWLIAFVGDLETLASVHPAVLLHLKQAFLDAFKNSGYTLYSVQQNLYRRAYSADGIVCPDKWAPKDRRVTA